MTQDGLRRTDFKVGTLNVSGTATFTGSINTNATISGANNVFHNNVNVTGSVNAANIELTGSLVAPIAKLTGSLVTVNEQVTGSITVSGVLETPLMTSKGLTISNIPALAIISGGMWCSISGASGTSPSFKVIPGPLDADYPTGICLTNTASGANVPILTRGAYQGLVAEATVVAGAGITAGSGAGLNTVLPAVAGKTRGTCMMGGGSEGVTAVYLF